MKQKSIEMKCISNILRVLIHDICFSFSPSCSIQSRILIMCLRRTKGKQQGLFKDEPSKIHNIESMPQTLILLFRSVPWCKTMFGVEHDRHVSHRMGYFETRPTDDW